MVRLLIDDAKRSKLCKEASNKFALCPETSRDVRENCFEDSEAASRPIIRALVEFVLAVLVATGTILPTISAISARISFETLSPDEILSCNSAEVFFERRLEVAAIFFEASVVASWPIITALAISFSATLVAAGMILLIISVISDRICAEALNAESTDSSIDFMIGLKDLSKIEYPPTKFDIPVR